MVTVTVSASDKNTTLQSNIQAFQSPSVATVAMVPSMPKTTVSVAVDAATKFVIIATRPVASERALKIQRLNQKLELGYSPPARSTRSR